VRSVPATLLVKALMSAGLAALLAPAVGWVHPLDGAALGLAAAAIGYAVGDRLVLPRYGNGPAVLAEFATGVGTLAVGARLWPGVRLPFGGALVVGGALAVAEILYHQYLVAQGVGTR
jgi:hypothetical protein